MMGALSTIVVLWAAAGRNIVPDWLDHPSTIAAGLVYAIVGALCAYPYVVELFINWYSGSCNSQGRAIDIPTRCYWMLGALYAILLVLIVACIFMDVADLPLAIVSSVIFYLIMFNSIAKCLNRNSMS